MKLAIVLIAVLLAACSLAVPGPTNGVPNGNSGSDLLPSALPASPDQAAAAQQSIARALQQIQQGSGVRLSGDSYIDDDGADIPAHLDGQIAPDGAMDLHVSVQFNQGTDTFEVRMVKGYEYTWDPNSSSWNTAVLGEPAAAGISALDPLFMNYPAQMAKAMVRVAPDDLVNSTTASVYEITLTSSDQNDQVTSRLWLAKDSGELLQEGVTLSNQAELPGGLGFNGTFLLQFQQASDPVTINPPAS
jgi:hypothetical protein